MHLLDTILTDVNFFIKCVGPKLTRALTLEQLYAWLLSPPEGGKNCAILSCK